MEKISSGIVRRVDELGRVVIPKELRRTLRIKEGEEMEVLVDGENNLVLKKYSAVKETVCFVREIVEVLSNATDSNVLVCDNDEIVAAARDKATFEGKPLSEEVEGLLAARKPRLAENFTLLCGGETYPKVAFCPVIKGGDVNGGVALVGEELPTGAAKLVEVAAGFLAKQL